MQISQEDQEPHINQVAFIQTTSLLYPHCVVHELEKKEKKQKEKNRKKRKDFSES